MHPFRVTEVTKRVVLDNICYALNNFLTCGAFENIVFCWVLHRREILTASWPGWTRAAGRCAPWP